MEKNDEDQEHDVIRDFYENEYYATVTEAVTVSRHLHRLAAKLGIRQGQQVLDVACGTGDWLMAMADRGAVPAGIDISQKAIAVCQKNMPTGDFHAGVAESLPFADDQFDVVSCLGSLEHFVDPLKALQEMVRVARKDARFLLLVPNADFLTARLGLYGGTNQIDAKEEVRTLEGWHDLFSDAGLSVVQQWKDLHVLSWSWIGAGRWLSVPIRALQALMLPFWPLRWQYQVYHLCRRSLT